MADDSMSNDTTNSQNTTQSASQSNDSAINDTEVNNTAEDAQAGNIEVTEEMQAFYKRADAIIELTNSQLSPTSHSGQVGASLLYAAARYSASVASIGFVKGDDLRKEKDEIIDFYTKQYRQMLSDNIDDYAQNFDKYININKPS